MALWGALLAFIFAGAVAEALTLTAVQSRKAHGAAGTFDLPIDATQSIGGPVTVEPRAIGAGHQIVFQFDAPITASGIPAAFDEAGAAVGALTASAAGNEVVVMLAGVPDNKRVTVLLSNVNGAGLDLSAALAFLTGDVNGSRSVTATDILQVKGRSGQAVDATNFKFDLNTSGSITASDILAVKGRSGLVLPAALTVGGTISGLTGTVVLRNNGGNDRTVSVNGSFTFATALANSSAYNVTVLTQPAGQTCTVANGAGTVSGTNVTNVTVTCAANAPTVLVVSVIDENGASAGAGVAVLVQGSNGALLQTLTTDSSGTAHATGVPAGGMITVAHFSAVANDWRVQTVTAVKPDDAITMTIGPVASVVPTFRGAMNVTLPVSVGASTYGFLMGCAQELFLPPPPTFLLNVYDNCGVNLDIVMLAVDATSAPLKFLPLTNVIFSDGMSIDATQQVWQALATHSSSVTNAPPGSINVSFRVSGRGAGGSYQFAFGSSAIAPGQGHLFQLSGPAQTALPKNERQIQLSLANLPSGQSRSTELLIRAATAGAIDADLSADLLPAISSAQIDSADPTRPTINVTTTAAAVADETVAQANWTSATRIVRWTVWAPGATTAFRYPEMPAAYQLSAADTATLETILLGESDAVSGYDAVRARPVTKFPFLPDVDGRHRVSYIYSP
jgi:hypothetical protein